MMRPPMPRCTPRSGPGSAEPFTPEVSSHIVLPRRRAAVSVRPVSAERNSPGEWGPAHERVGVVHAGYEPVQGLAGHQAAGGLDLRKFWHLGTARGEHGDEPFLGPVELSRDVPLGLGAKGVSGRLMSSRRTGTSGAYFAASLPSRGPLVWMRRPRCR